MFLLILIILFAAVSKHYTINPLLLFAIQYSCYYYVVLIIFLIKCPTFEINNKQLMFDIETVFEYC